MWMMLQHKTPDDFVVATGEAHSVRDFVERTFGYLGLDWQKYVEVDARYLRPTEVDHLLGDPGKARKLLGWKPKVTFDELVRVMVDHDMELARQEQTLRRAGHVVAESEGARR
jgi:GDPmannose 4,6-dehydratase